MSRYYNLVGLSAKCQVLATHQLPGESRGGDDDTVANAMMIGWVGGSRPAHAVSLHCQTQQDSDNGDEPGNFKGSFLKLEVPAILLARFN